MCADTWQAFIWRLVSCRVLVGAGVPGAGPPSRLARTAQCWDQKGPAAFVSASRPPTFPPPPPRAVFLTWEMAQVFSRVICSMGAQLRVVAWAQSRWPLALRGRTRLLGFCLWELSAPGPRCQRDACEATDHCSTALYMRGRASSGPALLTHAHVQPCSWRDAQTYTSMCSCTSALCNPLHMLTYTCPLTCMCHTVFGTPRCTCKCVLTHLAQSRMHTQYTYGCQANSAHTHEHPHGHTHAHIYSCKCWLPPLGADRAEGGWDQSSSSSCSAWTELHSEISSHPSAREHRGPRARTG